MEYLIALDIDSVLNNTDDHAYLSSVYEREALSRDNLLNRFQGMLDFYSHNGVVKYGWWVSRYRVSLVRDLVTSMCADVVGISSWFITQSHESVGEFLGFPINYTSTECGGGIQRAKGLLDFVLYHRPKYLVILDDQDMGWETYGLLPYHVKGINGVNMNHMSTAKTILSKEVDYHALERAYRQSKQ